MIQAPNCSSQRDEDMKLSHTRDTRHETPSKQASNEEQEATRTNRKNSNPQNKAIMSLDTLQIPLFKARESSRQAGSLLYAGCCCFAALATMQRLSLLARLRHVHSTTLITNTPIAWYWLRTLANKIPNTSVESLLASSTRLLTPEQYDAILSQRSSVPQDDGHLGNASPESKTSQSSRSRNKRVTKHTNELDVPLGMAVERQQRHHREEQQAELDSTDTSSSSRTLRAKRKKSRWTDEQREAARAREAVKTRRHEQLLASRARAQAPPDAQRQGDDTLDSSDDVRRIRVSPSVKEELREKAKVYGADAQYVYERLLRKEKRKLGIVPPRRKLVRDRPSDPSNRIESNRIIKLISILIRAALAIIYMMNALHWIG